MFPERNDKLDLPKTIIMSIIYNLKNYNHLAFHWHRLLGILGSWSLLTCPLTNCSRQSAWMSCVKLVPSATFCVDKLLTCLMFIFILCTGCLFVLAFSASCLCSALICLKELVQLQWPVQDVCSCHQNNSRHDGYDAHLPLISATSYLHFLLLFPVSPTPLPLISWLFLSCRHPFVTATSCLRSLLYFMVAHLSVPVLHIL